MGNGEASTEDFEARLESLRLRYLADLPQHRDGIAETWRGCAAGADSDEWQRLRDYAHRLSGSAPCYGLERVGDLARQLDKLLSGRAPCRDPAEAAPLVEPLLDALDAATGRA